MFRVVSPLQGYGFIQSPTQGFALGCYVAGFQPWSLCDTSASAPLAIGYFVFPV